MGIIKLRCSLFFLALYSLFSNCGQLKFPEPINYEIPNLRKTESNAHNGDICYVSKTNLQQNDLGFLAAPACFLIKDETILISDELQNHLYVFDTTGKIKRKIGRSGEGPGEFNTIGHFSISDNRIAINDVMSKFINVYDTTGTYLKRIDAWASNKAILHKSGFLLKGESLFLFGYSKLHAGHGGIIPVFRNYANSNVLWRLELNDDSLTPLGVTGHTLLSTFQTYKDDAHIFGNNNSIFFVYRNIPEIYDSRGHKALNVNSPAFIFIQKQWRKTEERNKAIAKEASYILNAMCNNSGTLFLIRFVSPDNINYISIVDNKNRAIVLDYNIQNFAANVFGEGSKALKCYLGENDYVFVLIGYRQNDEDKFSVIKYRLNGPC